MNSLSKKLFEYNKFKTLTPVQSEVLNAPLKGNDLIVKSDTGTGKTHAFLFAILEKIDPDLQQLQAIICAPTRELAMQTHDFAKPIHEIDPRIVVELAIGGMESQRLEAKLANQPQILIATPGKLLDMLNRNILRLDTVQTCVIDEMDMMLDYGFMPDINTLASSLLTQTQFMLFSATIPTGLKAFMKRYLRNPLTIEGNVSDMDPNIRHLLVNLRHRDVNEILLDVMSAINPSLAVIFCNTKKQAAEIAEYLRGFNVKLVELHGDIEDRARRQALNKIEHGDVHYIVATDLAARGIDLPEISHVINIGFPRHELDFYTHRAGRTGRSGRDGSAITIVSEQDEKSVRKLMSQGIKFSYIRILDRQIVEARPFYQTRKKPMAPDSEVSSILNRKKVVVKPGYKKRRKFEIDELMRKRRRDQIRTSIKEQKKQRAIESQRKNSGE